MSSLRSRVEEVTDRASKLPLVVLDSILPRQVLEIRVENNLMMELIRDRLEMERPYFGMVGMARLSSGEQVRLRSGVEVEILDRPVFSDDGKGGGGVMLKLRGGRRFVVDGEAVSAGGGWTEARVKFLGEGGDGSAGGDPVSLARARAQAKEFTSPNMRMEEGLSLVNRWIQLARENERRPGQIDALLEQLGEIPSSHEPSDCAFWVGALINPLPAMGVAMEIRPALLTADTCEERVEVALDGLFRSIRHMDGSAPMW